MAKSFFIDLRTIIAAVILVAAGIVIAYFVGGANSGNSNGAAGNTDQQRELLARIGEYERREADRNRREAQRIAAERDRIKRTQDAIDAIRRSDRRSGSLYEEIIAECNVLESYFRDSSSQFSDNDSYNGSTEVEGSGN